MKIAAVVVLYNPNKVPKPNDVRHNIMSYAQKLEKVFVIDNSDCDNSNLLRDIKNLDYIPLNKNFGIAAALNIGCEKALQEGFDWCLTMDQDSYWDENEFENYLDSAKKLVISNDEKVASISPRLKMPVKSLHDIFVNIARPFYYKIRKPPEYKIIDRTITSGNLIRLSVWSEIGKFDENLFIDGVDFDYCFRLQKIGYKIVWTRAARLNHSIGDDKFRLFKSGKHNDFRLYYMVRNNIYLAKIYPEFVKDKKYINIIFENCLFSSHPLKKYKIIKKARADALKLIEGQK